MAKGLSQKEKDILKVLLVLDKKLKEDLTYYKNKKTETSNKREKLFYQFMPKVAKRLKFRIGLRVLELDKSPITQKSAYRSLERLEKRGLIKKIKKGKYYIADVKITSKGIETLK